MKKVFFSFLAFLFAIAFPSISFAQCNAWTQKTDFGGAAIGGAVGFSIGSKGYIGTGADNVGYQDFWEYDTASNTWTQKADFGGTGRLRAVGFSIGSKGYIGTGYDVGANYKYDFWEYDPAGNAWTQKADFGGIWRESAVGFSIGNKGYIGTGYDGMGTIYQDFWEYDPAGNAWTQKADFGGTARLSAVGFSIGNKGYIGTGFDGGTNYKNDFWEYDPAGNAWTQKADFGGTGRLRAVGFSIGTKGYIGTGDDGGYKQDFWEYDTASNTWAQKTDFGGTAREGAVGLSIGNKGYIGTGWDGVGYQDFWEYMPGVTANAGSDTAICSGSTIIGGSSTASGIFQSYIYSWSPSGSLNDSTIANPTATPTNTTTYIVTVTDSLGCTTTDTVTVTLPSPLSTNIIKTDVSCNGYNDGAANLTVTGGFTPYAYSWSTGATTQNISGVSANTYTVTITEYCGSTASDGVTITQSSILVASAGNDTSICKGENAALGGSPTALGGTASYTYLWSPSIGLSSTTSSNPSASPNSLTTYTVQVTDANGCTATDNVTVDNFVLPSQPICLITVDSSSTRNVMVWEKPATAGIDSFKIYRDIIGVYTHIESVPYDSLSTFTDTTQGVNPNTTAYRYKLSGVDTCGNESALSDFHKTIHLQISPGTGNNVNLNWDDYLGFSFTFYRILRDDFGTGNWQKIDSVSAGVTSYTDALPSDSARYIVEVVPPNVCTATKTTEYYNSSRSNAATKTGSTQNIQSSIYNQNSAIEIIPNPTKGKFEIRYKGIWEIGVYNVLGERVYWSVVSGKSQVIDISNQPKGIYFLQLKTGEGIMNKKVILQ